MKRKPFEVGQKAWSIQLGECEITAINNSGIDRYPIIVSVDEEPQETYTLDGKHEIDHVFPSLYHEQPEWAKPQKFIPEQGQWCWFWDDGGKTFYIAQAIVQDNLYRASGGSIWKNCAPFTGEFPEGFNPNA